MVGEVHRIELDGQLDDLGRTVERCDAGDTLEDVELQHADGPAATSRSSTEWERTRSTVAPAGEPEQSEGEG